LASVAGNAHAGGMEYPDLGTVAIGRGTAFVARADNPSAFYYNPAGLAKQKRGHVLVGANLVNLNVRYLRDGSGGLVTLGEYDWGTLEVDNPDTDWSDGPTAGKPFTEVSQTGLGPAPMIVASWGGIGKAEDLAISVGVIPPSSFGGHEYDPDGPQRYNLVKTDNMILYPGVGLAYAVNRYFQIGAVFLSGIGLVDIARASRPLPQPGLPHHNEDRRTDAAFQVTAKDFFMPTGIVGVLSNPADWIEVGVSVRLPVRMEAAGKYAYGAPEAHPDYALVDDPNSLLLKQTLPTILRVGGRYIHEWFDVEVDLVYENWKTLDYVELESDAALDKGDGSAPTQLPDVQIPRKYRDTVSVRLGGDVNAIPDKLAVRAGGFYQTSAYPENYETFSLDFPYGEQVGAGAGLSWHVIEHLSLNVGYSHIFQRDVLVTQGIVQQTGLPYEPGDGNQYNVGNTVNNGTYQVSINLVGLSAEGNF
jgi:long-chain fatty acid transport protein